MLRRAVSIVLLAVLGVLAVPGTARAQELISSFDVQIEVAPDGAMTVTETIAYDFGSASRHGIFRDIPTALRYDDTFDRVYPLEVVSVTATGGASDDVEVADA